MISMNSSPISTRLPAVARRLWLASLAALCLLTTAGAQVCIGPALGVPPNYNAPHWWDNSGGQPAYYQDLNDPRWSGAAAINYTKSFDDGTSSSAMFQALHDSTSLYLSWRFQGMPASSATQNTLFLGVERPNIGTVIVEVSLAEMSQQKAACGGQKRTLRTFLRNPTTGQEQVGGGPAPPELEQTACVWVNDPQLNLWAVAIQMPKSMISFGAGDTFNMWYQIMTGTPEKPVVPLSWPRAAAITDGPAPDYNAVYPAPSQWQQYRLSAGANDAACKLAGVSLDRYKIGTQNTPESAIQWRKAADGGPLDNWFHAQPLNHSGVPIPAGKLSAKFRIANWGSLPDWESVAQPASLWQEIGAASNSADIADGAQSDQSNDIRFNWPLTDAEILPFENGAKAKHQCVLVEMSSSIPDLVFVNRSIYRNMDLVKASTFERSAEISIRGLAPISTAGRDVYLYVETQNMPAKVAGGKAQPQPSMEVTRPIQESITHIDQPLVPTYRVHVFHDSGKSVTLHGVRRLQLEPQGSFGYYVSHDGALYGWNHSLAAQGFTLEELAPNFYRVAKVPNDGSFAVITTIQALNRPPIEWWKWLLALLILIVIVVWLFLRKKTV